MKIINYLFLYLISFTSIVSSVVFAQPSFDAVNSEQRYVYKVSYKKIKVGEMTREFNIQGDAIKVKSSVDLSFLFYHFGGTQLSDLYWDKDSQLFLSRRFVRKSVGFQGEEVQADFLQAGHQAIVVRNGKTRQFDNKENKIVDFNAISMQIAEGLKMGQTHFDFYMLSDKKVKHNFFEVKGKDLVMTPLGKFETFRLEQTQIKNRKLHIWFAPKLNYQMIKFYYKFKLLDLRGIIKHKQ